MRAYGIKNKSNGRFSGCECRECSLDGDANRTRAREKREADKEIKEQSK